MKVAEDHSKKKPEMISEKNRLRNDITNLNGEAKRLVDALGNGNGETSRIITERLTEVESSIEAKQRRLTEMKEELIQMERQIVDRDDIKKILEAFNPIWDVLYPKEQARIMQLLIDQVAYNGADGTIAITFHPTGIKTLASEMN